LSNNLAFEKKIRVLIVEDSAIMRRLIMNALLRHPDIEVVGTAANGVLAIEAIKKIDPDIITLDVEMPEMDGLTALKEIRKFKPALPIIMFSTQTQRGAKVTMEALTNGASDYVGKPSNVTDLEAAYAVLEKDLIPKIRSLCSKENMNKDRAPSLQDRGKARREQQAMSSGLPLESPKKEASVTFSRDSNSIVKRPVNKTNSAVYAVVIGVSTGGPAALMRFFELLKTPLRVPIFIVQHMPPKFTELLAARLTEIGTTPVAEPYDGEEALPGRAYIAPGGWHMCVKQKGVKVIMTLNEDPPENSCRPAVDVLFRSAAKVYGQSLLAVVLTGMGSDGLKGAQEIVSSKGTVIVQDKETSVIWGMPGAISEADLAEKVLPLDQIPDEIVYRMQFK
jgi:two-component system, chemotaxis family, protein-glutamate methylesterase/glutaminase